MTVDTLRAILVAMGATDPDSLARVRSACPDLAEQCADLATGDFAPGAGIGHVEPARKFAAYDHDAIDAAAEREGLAADKLEQWGVYRRYHDGRSTCQWDYQRVIRAQAISDSANGDTIDTFGPRRGRKGRMRNAIIAHRDRNRRNAAHIYQRIAAIEAWEKICADFAADNWRQYVWRGDWRPAWMRDESRERRAQRQLNRARRDIIRLVGSLAKSGNVRAVELYRTLQPAGVATGRKRK